MSASTLLHRQVHQMHCVYNPFIDWAENFLESFVKTNFFHSEIRDECRF